MMKFVRNKQEMMWFGVLFGIMGFVYGNYIPANYGIKTKTYQHDPITTTVYEHHQQQPQQTITYHQTTKIQRLSPEQSTSISSSDYRNGYNNNQNEFQYEQHQPQNFQYQQQGNSNYNQANQYQQQIRTQSQHYANQNGQQQTGEQPLYHRKTEAHTVNTNWNDAENAITEYYTGCPAGHTGPLPYAYDCRRFLNCWKGHGHIQSCGTGTVFNPETLECDSPHKVTCGALSTLGETASSGNSHSQQYNQNANYRTGRLMDVNTENVDVLCPHGMSGLQAHPKDCTKFINCANGNVHVQECGPGTAYSPSMMVCDFKDKVDCGTRDYHYGEGLLDIRSESTGSNDFVKKSKVTCPSDAAGLFAHPYDCTKFLNCANGMTYIQDCGPGTAFDSVNKVCDYKYKVKCGDGVKTDVSRTEVHSHDIGNINTQSTNWNGSLTFDLFCPNGVTGLFLHPFDYTKFLNCRNGNTAIQNCVSGKVFSILKRFCDDKDSVLYTDHVSYIVSEVSFEYSKMLMSCPPETEGLHVYPYDCTRYVKCLKDGRLLVLECQTNFIFSLSLRKCLPKQQVQNNDRVKYVHELNERLKTSQLSSEFSFNSTYFDNTHMVGCPIGLSGLYPYPFDSIKFLRCRNGRLSVETCSSGTAFSLSQKQCVLKENLKPSDMVLFRREFAEEWSIEVSYGYGYSPANAYITCPPKIEEGIFLHPFDCLKYIKCHKGNTSIENCLNGTVFSISKETCVNRDEVEAYDRVDFHTDIKHEFSTDATQDWQHQNSAICPPNVVGLFPHPNDPRKYLKCTADYQTFIENCTPGTYFSNSKRYCDLYERVAASDRTALSSTRDHYVSNNIDESKRSVNRFKFV